MSQKTLVVWKCDINHFCSKVTAILLCYQYSSFFLKLNVVSLSTILKAYKFDTEISFGNKDWFDIEKETCILWSKCVNIWFVVHRWYQIKISMRWEDTNCTLSPGSPSRVMQYEGTVWLAHYHLSVIVCCLPNGSQRWT